MYDNDGHWAVTEAPRPLGAIATRPCTNPDCLAERGERHDPECTVDPAYASDGAWQDRRDWS